MSFLARLVATLLARFRAMGFLEWAGIASLIDTVLTYDVKQQANKIIVEEVAKNSGLGLDENDPLSDASIANAVSVRIGITLRSVKDRDKIKEDMDTYVADLLSQKTGFQVRSVSDALVLKQDLTRIAAAELSAQLGIPVGVIAEDGGEFDPEAVRHRLLLWAKAQLMTEINGEARVTLNEIVAAQGLEAFALSANRWLEYRDRAERVTAQEIALMLADEMAVGAIGEWQKAARDMTKRERRQEQLRHAQDKFRRRHGNRQVYVPIGMTATVT